MLRFKTVFLVFLSLLVFSAPHVWADSGCIHVSAQGQASSIDPMTPFATYKGTLLMSLADQPPVEAALTIVLRETKVGDDGTIHMINAMTVVMPDGSALKMDDNAIISPTETPLVYRINARLDNFEGAGFFANTFGLFIGHGTLSLSSAHLEVVSEGRICW